MPLFPRKRRALPALPAGERIYAIGDVHGRLDLFEDMLARLAADNAGRPRARALVILLGDLIDRGPDSAAVVRRAMRPLGWAQTRLLRGNHEAAMLDALDGDRAMLSIWLRNGGIAALESWGLDRDTIGTASAEALLDLMRAAIPAAERGWLLQAAPALQIGDYYFVHAGVRPGVKLADQRIEDMLWIRDEFLDSRRDHGAIVVHGHSIADDVEERDNRIGIDTGAYASGRLTALGLEGSERWFIQT